MTSHMNASKLLMLYQNMKKVLGRILKLPVFKRQGFYRTYRIRKDDTSEIQAISHGSVFIKRRCAA